MLVVFILIAGLRYRIGVDTVGYLYTYYHDTPNLSYYLSRNIFSVSSFIWRLINSFFYTIGAPFYVIQILTAAFINCLFFAYIKKHSNYLFSCLFFYFVGFYPLLNFETMKASYAIAICLFANDFFLEKKWIKGLLLYLVATGFHLSTIGLFIVPALLFLRFNKWGVVFLLITYIGGGYIQKVMGDYLFIFDMLDNDTISNKLEGYTESDKYGSAMRLLSIIKNVPLILYSFISVKYLFKCDRHNRLLMLEPFLMIAMLLLVLQFNIYIFYRLFDFFFIYLCLFFSQLFVDLAKSRRFQKSLSYTRALLFILPLVVIFLWKYQSKNRFRYYPYATIIDKSIDKDREELFNSIREGKTARFDEY